MMGLHHVNTGDVLSRLSSRREFVARTAIALAGIGVLSSRAIAQEGAQGTAQEAAQAQPGQLEMPASSYKPVSRPPKPNAKPSMDVRQVEAFERQLACPCPCTLDIYTCRTTDFQCGISPAVHGDIQRLVDGGYTADEIMEAMLGTYGDFILNSPRKQGFNLLAWFAPFAGLALGAVGVGALLRSWRMNARASAEAAAARASSSPAAGNVVDSSLDATPDEMARLQAALKDDR
ncbi:MAG: cytochrome c-type biogenesis protein CcmH [Gemmatimonadaceae bacterium]|nr:cytochrome c-type biogenesis protein CcmH [Gemmatimonadaceae bacterium]